MMTDEKENKDPVTEDSPEGDKKEGVEDNGNISNDKPAPEKKQKPKPLPTVPKPTATVPRKPKAKPAEKPPTNASGIDVTANMDNDQKERFKKIQDKAQVIPQIVDTQRPFCERLRAIKERRKARRARG